MGRKKGQKAGMAVKQVKANWRPRDSAIVYMYASGHYSQKELAEHFGVTTQTIVNTLAKTQAQEILDKIQDQMRIKLTESIPDKVLELQVKSVERLAETMNEEFVPGSKAKMHQDRVGLGLLSKFVNPKAEEPSRDSNKPSVSEALANRFISALEKSNEVALLQAKKEEAEIVEADVISIETIPSKQRTA